MKEIWKAVWGLVLSIFKLILKKQDNPPTQEIPESQDIKQETQEEVEDVPEKTDDELTDIAVDSGLVRRSPNPGSSAGGSN